MTKKYKEENNPIMVTVCDGAQQAVKRSMNSMYGVNGQQGHTLIPLAELNNDKLEKLQSRLMIYEKVEKELSNSKVAQLMKCYQLYKSAAENMRHMISTFQLIQQSNGASSDSSDGNKKTNLISSFNSKARLERKIHHEIQRTRNTGGFWAFYPLGSLICTLARNYIAINKELVMKEFPGVLVVGGDTDSLFFECSRYLELKGFSRKKDSFEFEVQLYKLGLFIANTINTYWKNRACKRGQFEFELEGIFRVLVISKGKKYYFALKLIVLENKDGSFTIKVGNLKITGIELKRRNMCKLIRDIQLNIITKTCNNQIQEAIDDTRKEIVRLVKKQVPMEQLVVINVLGQDPDDMTVLSASAAVALQNEKLGLGFARKKEEISFVYIIPQGKCIKNLKKTEMVMGYLHAKETNAKIDYSYYIHNHFKAPLIKLLSPVVKNIETLYNEWIIGAENQSIQNLFLNIGKKNFNCSNNNINNKRDLTKDNDNDTDPNTISAVNLDKKQRLE